MDANILNLIMRYINTLKYKKWKMHEIEDCVNLRKKLFYEICTTRKKLFYSIWVDTCVIE